MSLTAAFHVTPDTFPAFANSQVENSRLLLGEKTWNTFTFR